MRETYMRNGEGFLLVYSIAERDTLYEVTRFHEEILRVKDSDTPPPIIMLGNKCDKEDERAISTNGAATPTYTPSCVLMPFVEGRSVAQQLGVQFFETSAKTRINIDESFEALVREMRAKTKVCWSFVHLS
jgi:GTPase KRas